MLRKRRYTESIALTSTASKLKIQRTCKKTLRKIAATRKIKINQKNLYGEIQRSTFEAIRTRFELDVLQMRTRLNKELPKGTIRLWRKIDFIRQLALDHRKSRTY